MIENYCASVLSTSTSRDGCGVTRDEERKKCLALRPENRGHLVNAVLIASIIFLPLLGSHTPGAHLLCLLSGPTLSLKLATVTVHETLAREEG